MRKYTIYRRPSWPKGAKPVKLASYTDADEAREMLATLLSFEGGIGRRDLIGHAAQVWVSPKLPPESCQLSAVSYQLEAFARLALADLDAAAVMLRPAFIEPTRGLRNVELNRQCAVSGGATVAVLTARRKAGRTLQKQERAQRAIARGKVRGGREGQASGLLGRQSDSLASVAAKLELLAGPRRSPMTTPGYETHGHSSGFSVNNLNGFGRSYGPRTRFYKSRRS